MTFSRKRSAQILRDTLPFAHDFDEHRCTLELAGEPATTDDGIQATIRLYTFELDNGEAMIRDVIEQEVDFPLVDSSPERFASYLAAIGSNWAETLDPEQPKMPLEIFAPKLLEDETLEGTEEFEEAYR